MAEDTPRRRSCGTMQVHRRLLDTEPGYARRMARIEEQAFRARAGFALMRPGCTLIPVVVHVVHRTAEQDISRAQIESQIAVLNQDFRKTNPDVVNTPPPFAPLASDARVQFELARTDPSGAPTDGVVRVKTTVNGFDSDDLVKSSATGGSDAWPRDEYLNVWVCELVGGLLGYAQFPGGAPATDGVVITHTAFGTSGTAAAPFDKGRTATHEIGHWLNLRHIWGDDGEGCSGSDFVDDTPNQGGPNTSKPTFPTLSCNNGPNGDMFMNYMDYVDDDAMVMFTEGQVARMQACLDGPRSAIGTSISSEPTASLLPPVAAAAAGPFPPGKPFKEFPKESPKDIIKEPFKEFPKDPPKEFPKDFPKDPPKEFPKDPPKDFPKDPPKDFPKDPPKEFPKDVIKEPVKDFVKDRPKEFPKELTKDLPKEGVLDPGPKPLKEFAKDPITDPQKSPFEPPTPPIDLPVDPGGPVPFVLGTGGAREAQPASPAQEILGHYAWILAQYAGLHQRGLLDAQGLAAWQQAHAAYLRAGGR